MASYTTYTAVLVIAALLGAGIAIWWMKEEPIPILPLKNSTKPSYDYIIVGGGSAGCVVAARLSEDPATTVLLLEAGDDGADNVLRVPVFRGSQSGGKRDWKYPVTKQEKACRVLNGQQCFLGRGKTLGGTGAINGMLYSRGSRDDYDRWAELGATGWAAEDVLPYFMKSENAVSEELRRSPSHGTSGPMGVSILKATPIADYLHQAAVDLGLSAGQDFNDFTHSEGVHYMQVHMAEGVATSSTAHTFLWPAMKRPNLDVVVHAHVTKVLLEGKTAVGIEYKGKDGVIRKVTANKEVILSAGAVASPQLLLLSGIGPKKHLEDLGIPVVADLPVGEKTINSISMLVPQVTISVPIAITSDFIMSFTNELRYKLWKTGPRANAYFVDNIIRIRSEYAKKMGEKSPDIDILIMAMLFKATSKGSFHAADEVANEYFRKSGAHGLTPLFFMTRPKSTGTIRLRSTDPFDTPLIDPNYLHRKEDGERLVEGIRYLERLLNTDTMQKIGARFLDYSAPLPSCRDHKVGTDAYWDCFVHHVGYASGVVGSCKMGAKDDPNAVVDPQLRVRGVKNLRVIDSSIMPTNPTGPNNAPTIMVAEKGADIIKGVKPMKKPKKEGKN